jgi:epoxyqueuosine reductase
MLVAGLAYAGGVSLRRSAAGPELQVAGYARGQDYHRVLKQKLRALADRVADLSGRAIKARALVDTAPLLEREAARRAGVGFIGKSGMLISPGRGSYLLLGVLLLDLELEPSEATSVGCGRCRTCLDACPTGAFIGPYQLDARRCIAYLTIEYDGLIPRELREPIGLRVFGCDECQDVCPYNQAEGAPGATALLPRQALLGVGLVELLELSSGGYRRLVRGSAMGRARRQSLQRNAAVALGNSDWPGALPPLAQCVLSNPSAVVRAHACWALGRLAHHNWPLAERTLKEASELDPDSVVREEASLALSEAASGKMPGAEARD